MRDSQRHLTSEMSDCATPPPPPRRASGFRQIRVLQLDGAELKIDIERKARGGALLERVCEGLDVRETDYFGLQREWRGGRVWVDLDKRLSKTFKNAAWEVRFGVRFHPRDPAAVGHPAREQLMLALRTDLLEGRLSCSFVTRALLGSYLLQAQLGDLRDLGALELDTLRELGVAPDELLDEKLLEKVTELYEMHQGQPPSMATDGYLAAAARLPRAGCAVHRAGAGDGAPLLLAVGGAGVGVYRDDVLQTQLPWAKITKISYAGRLFSLRLRPAPGDRAALTVGFRLPARRQAARLWRETVEAHMFYRRAEPVAVRHAGALGALGGRRLSCRRTLRQLTEDAPARAAA